LGESGKSGRHKVVLEEFAGHMGADPKMRARLADLSGTPLPGSSAQFGKLIANETEKWAKVIKFAGVKPQ
jgi:hypothetical protein